jgi:hypothetical protein
MSERRNPVREPVRQPAIISIGLYVAADDSEPIISPAAII